MTEDAASPAVEPDQESAAATAEEAAAPAAKTDKLQQQVEITDIGPCKKHVKVTIDRASIEQRLDAKFRDLLKNASVPGFRKGKAPRKIVERHFHKEVAQEVRTELLLASLEQLGEEQHLAPLAPPDLHPEQLQLPEQGPLVYEFDVEVRPEFALPPYKGLKLKRPVRQFTEADIDREVKRLLAPRGQLVPKEGPVALEDYLTVDITTHLGERLIGQAQEVVVRVEPRLAFRDGVAERFAEQIVGARAGEQRLVDIHLSEQVADEQLRGQTVQATFTIKEVKELRLPELTPEFLRQLGVRSEEQLREQALRLLELRLAYEQRQAARQQVLQYIAEVATWELPQDLLRRQARRALARRLLEMREAGLSEEEIQARQRLLQQDVLRSTAQALKEHFVLQRIAEEEKIDVTEEEVEQAIADLAERSGESPRRLRARLEKEDLLEALALQLIERKVLDLILQHAEYEDVPIAQPPEPAVATVEEQAVPGTLHDPTAAETTAPPAHPETPPTP